MDITDQNKINHTNMDTTDTQDIRSKLDTDKSMTVSTLHNADNFCIYQHKALEQ